MPYRGNKSRIADKIIDILPAGERLVDLFGGGGAITHCALMRGKWRSYLYNDINPLITQLFIDAVNGVYHDEHRVISREDFNRLKTGDPYVKYIWSFNNNGRDYLWAKNLEESKILACHMLMDENPHDRRMAYRRFLDMLNTPDVEQDILKSLTELQPLQRLEALQRLEVSNIDYRMYEYRGGDVVYGDIPYEKCGTGKCDDYDVVFDTLEFYRWAKNQPYQIYFSSFKISDDAFYCMEIGKYHSMYSAATGGGAVVEYLYSNRDINK